MPRPTRWKGCVNGLKGRVRACFICPPIRLTSTPSKWPAPKLSSSCARLKRALWKHSMRRLLRPYKLFLRAMLKASSSMSDSVYDSYGNRYRQNPTEKPTTTGGEEATMKIRNQDVLIPTSMVGNYPNPRWWDAEFARDFTGDQEPPDALMREAL